MNEENSVKKPIIVLQSDFTYKEGAVASMYGVIKSISRDIEVVDATHEIPRFNIWSASYRLSQYVKFWPKGTIFVSVVDPGVGTSRKASIAFTKNGYYILSPDNGTFTHALLNFGIEEIREIDIKKHRLKGYGTENTAVFHGRDVFSNCAALLASKKVEFCEFGKKYSVEDIISFELNMPSIAESEVTGIFEIGDPNFGNLWTNIPLNLFNEAGFKYGNMVKLKVLYNGKEVFCNDILFERTFGNVNQNELVVYTNELMNIAVAINMDSLIDKYSLGYGVDWEVIFSHV